MSFLFPISLNMFCPSVFPTLSHRRITIAHGDRFVIGQLICYPNKGEVTGRVWSLSPFPRPSKQRGPASSASNTSQYSRSAWGSQPPEGSMFLPFCFAFLKAAYLASERKTLV